MITSSGSGSQSGDRSGERVDRGGEIFNLLRHRDDGVHHKLGELTGGRVRWDGGSSLSRSSRLSRSWRVRWIRHDGGDDRYWGLFDVWGRGWEFYWPWPGRGTWGIVLGDELRDEVFKLRGVLLRVTSCFVN